jgi:hypothetical protein
VQASAAVDEAHVDVGIAAHESHPLLVTCDLDEREPRRSHEFVVVGAVDGEQLEVLRRLERRDPVDRTARRPDG